MFYPAQYSLFENGEKTGDFNARQRKKKKEGHIGIPKFKNIPIRTLAVQLVSFSFFFHLKSKYVMDFSSILRQYWFRTF